MVIYINIFIIYSSKKRWSEEEVNTFIDLIKLKKPRCEMALILNRSRSSLVQKYNQLLQKKILEEEVSLERQVRRDNKNWTPEDLEILRKYGGTKKWTSIGSILHRSAESCRKKYYRLDEEEKESNSSATTWDISKYERLLQLVKEDSHKRMPWSVMANKMDQINEFSLIIRWQLINEVLSASSSIEDPVQ